MKIHEYQARELLASYGLPVDGAFVCYNVEEAVEAYRKLNAPLIVVKAQVHTGEHRQAGGVGSGLVQQTVLRSATDDVQFFDGERSYLL